MKLILSILAIIPLLLVPNVVYAGMPSFTLTDMANVRLSTISFFLFIYFVSSFILYALWNYLRKDFKKLPVLSFKKALAFIFLWGLAFHLVLVMIAGTRELMTPQAWQKAGIIHKLSPDSFQQLMDIRRHKLDQLKKALWLFAKKNEGYFPPTKTIPEIPSETWMTPRGKLQYIYIENLKVNKALQPLAYETNEYGEERMVLFTNGMIELLPINSIQAMINGVKND